ncbi:MAG: hypothetical protein ABWZ82_04100 [Candidatus Limnocylindrales bacterium]
MRSTHGARRASVVGIAGVLLAMGAGTTVAQGQNTIHLEIEGGPKPGTYDLTSSRPCRVGFDTPTMWTLDGGDGVTDPTNVSIAIDPAAPESSRLSVTFADFASYYEKEPGVATLDDRGDSATLTLTLTDVYGTAADGSDVPGGSVTATVECTFMDRFALSQAPSSLPPAPSLVPVAGGQAARVTIAGGPHPGTYDWSIADPCTRLPGSSDGRFQWFAGTVEPDPQPAYLGIELIFDETGNDDVRVDVDFDDVMYRLQGAPPRRVDDQGDHATIQLAGPSSYLERASGTTGQAGLLELSLVCSAIE